MAWHVPEGFRKEGEPDSQEGAFIVPIERDKRGDPILYAYCRASNGGGWEHVSVTLATHERWNRCLTWEEMCAVKRWFWDDMDVVMQLHVAAKDNINIHPFCLHLWRPTDPGMPIPLPPAWMV